MSFVATQLVCAMPLFAAASINIDLLIMVLATIGGVALFGATILGLVIWYYFRDIDDADGLPSPSLAEFPPIVPADSERAMARACSDAGYMANADYLEVVDRINAAMAQGMDELIQTEFPNSKPARAA